VFERILIATDGSIYSKKAAKAGIELARLSGGQAIIVYVVDIGYVSSAALIPPFGGASPNVIDNFLQASGRLAKRQRLKWMSWQRRTASGANGWLLRGIPPARY